MIKTVFIGSLTLILVYFGLGIISTELNIPRQDVVSWTGIIFVAYSVEKILKYILQLPLKHYFEALRKQDQVQLLWFFVNYANIFSKLKRK